MTPHGSDLQTCIIEQILFFLFRPLYWSIQSLETGIILNRSMHSLKQAMLCLLCTRWNCFAIVFLIDCYLYFVLFHDQKSTSSLNTKTTPTFRQSSSLMIKINDHAEFDSPFLLCAYKSICWVMAGYTSAFFFLFFFFFDDYHGRIV